MIENTSVPWQRRSTVVRQPFCDIMVSGSRAEGVNPSICLWCRWVGEDRRADDASDIWGLCHAAVTFCIVMMLEGQSGKKECSLHLWTSKCHYWMWTGCSCRSAACRNLQPDYRCYPRQSQTQWTGSSWSSVLDTSSTYREKLFLTWF